MEKDRLDEVLRRLFSDNTIITLGDALQAVIGSISLVKDKADPWVDLQNEDEELSNILINTLTNTIVYNLMYIGGYDEEEIQEISELLGDTQFKKFDTDKYDA